MVSKLRTLFAEEVDTTPYPIGGISYGACGFAIGMERLVEIFEAIHEREKIC